MTQQRDIGIDYGLGATNVDRTTGIHFGVINMNSLNEFAWDSFEADYGEPHCPKCGNEAVEYNDEDHSDYEAYSRGCADFACTHCGHYLDSEYVYGDEPVVWTLDDGEYQAAVDSYNDVFLVKSPYFTYAQFCSPCAPGAGHLSHPRSADSGAPRVYCFGIDWFPGNRAPYDIYSVDTGELVQAATKDSNYE